MSPGLTWPLLTWTMTRFALPELSSTKTLMPSIPLSEPFLPVRPHVKNGLLCGVALKELVAVNNYNTNNQTQNTQYE